MWVGVKAIPFTSQESLSRKKTFGFFPESVGDFWFSKKKKQNRHSY
jgi:hypothetical protein